MTQQHGIIVCVAVILPLLILQNAVKLGSTERDLDNEEEGVCEACGDYGQCACDFGYEGPACEREVDWCQQPMHGVLHKVSHEEMCGTHGTCNCTVAGAFCDCKPGYTGTFCHEAESKITEPPTTKEINVTCEGPCVSPCLFRSSEDPKHKDIPEGCRNSTGEEYAYRCVPQDKRCKEGKCNDPIGWCIPVSWDIYRENGRSIPELIRVIKEKDKKIEKKDEKLEEKDKEIEKKDEKLEEKDKEIEKKDEKLEEKDKEIEKKDKKIEKITEEKAKEIEKITEENDKKLEEKDKKIAELMEKIASKEANANDTQV